MAATTNSESTSTPGKRQGGKHTVYMSAEQEKAWKDSGLTISDVIDRGLQVVPISIDGKAPEEMWDILNLVGRVSLILAHGGTIYTPYAAQQVLEERSDPGHLEKLDQDAASLNEVAAKAPSRKRPSRSKKGQGEPASEATDAVAEHAKTVPFSSK